MAPVTGAVADGEEDQLVLLFCLRNRFLAPRIPVDRIVGVLQEIGTGGVISRFVCASADVSAITGTVKKTNAIAAPANNSTSDKSER